MWKRTTKLLLKSVTIERYPTETQLDGGTIARLLQKRLIHMKFESSMLNISIKMASKESFKQDAHSSHAIQTDSSGTKGFKILEMYSYIFILSEKCMLYKCLSSWIFILRCRL